MWNQTFVSFEDTKMVFLQLVHATIFKSDASFATAPSFCISQDGTRNWGFFNNLDVATY